MRKLPVLQKSSLSLGAPCDEPFLEMPRSGRGRHCEKCSRTVVDMTRMTRREAEALFDAEGESLCGYVLANDAGETFFAAPPRFPSVLATGLTAALLVSGCGATEQHPSAPVAVTAPNTAPVMMPIRAKQNGPETEVLETAAPETEPCETEAPVEAEPLTDADAGPAPHPRPHPRPVPRPGGIRRLPPR
jgi:hypothetical protein